MELLVIGLSNLYYKLKANNINGVQYIHVQYYYIIIFNIKLIYTKFSLFCQVKYLQEKFVLMLKTFFLEGSITI